MEDDGAPQPAEPTAARPSPVRAHRQLAWGIAATVVGLAVVALGLVVLRDRGGGPSAVGAASPAPALVSPSLGPVSGEESTPLPRERLPAFPGGQVVDLSDYDHPLVINFWATWCAPCVEEMPMLQRVWRQTKGELAFLGVNVQDNADKARGFLHELGITYDQASDSEAEFFTEVGGFGMPTTLFIDASGTIRYRHTGMLDEQQLTDLLRLHLDVDM